MVRGRSASAPPFLERWASGYPPLHEEDVMDPVKKSTRRHNRSFSLDLDLKTPVVFQTILATSSPASPHPSALALALEPYSLPTTPTASPQGDPPSPPCSPPPGLSRTTSAQGLYSEPMAIPDRRGAKSAPPDLAPADWDFGNPWIITDYDYVCTPEVAAAVAEGDIFSPLPEPLAVSVPPRLPESVVLKDDAVLATIDPSSPEERDPSPEPVTASATSAPPVGSSSSKKSDRKGKRERDREQRMAATSLLEAKAARRKEKRKKREIKAVKKLEESETCDTSAAAEHPLDQPANSVSAVEAEVIDTPDEVQLEATMSNDPVVDSVPLTRQGVTTAATVPLPEEVVPPLAIEAAPSADEVSPTNDVESPPPNHSSPTRTPAAAQPAAWMGDADLDIFKSTIMGAGEGAPVVQRHSPLRHLKRTISDRGKTEASSSNTPNSLQDPATSSLTAGLRDAVGAPTTLTPAPPDSRFRAESSLGLQLSGTSGFHAGIDDGIPSKSSKPKRKKKRAARQTATTSPTADTMTFWADGNDGSPAIHEDPAIAVIVANPSAALKRKSLSTLRLLPPLIESLNGSGNGLLPNIEHISSRPLSQPDDSSATPELSLTSLSSSPQSSELETPPPASPTESPADSPATTPRARTFPHATPSPTSTYCDSSTPATSLYNSAETGPRHRFPGVPEHLFAWQVFRRLEALRRQMVIMCYTIPDAATKYPNLAKFVRGYRFDGFVDKMRLDLRLTGTCERLDSHWEELLILLWEALAVVASTRGRPTPSWDQVSYWLWVDPLSERAWLDERANLW